MSRSFLAAWTIFGLTLVQLLVGTLATGLPQFDGKAFAGRLALYPLMMLAVPAVWWLIRRRQGGTEPLPWAGIALIMAPFLVDVTGNTLDLYDMVVWWDDANHLVNWALLSGGIGLLLTRSAIAPRWALAVAVTGIGATLAILWEIGEYYAFIRNGTELDTAYEDTLGDEALGTAGAFVAALVVAANAYRVR